MRIALFALCGSFQYTQIGGTDSFMRRLSNAVLMADKNTEIDWIFYGSQHNFEIIHSPRFRSIYIKKFSDALVELKNYSKILVGYIASKDRVPFLLYRKNNKTIIFHSLIFFYPKSSLKRAIKFLEYFLYPYNGRVFCVSNRQYKELENRIEKISYLPPIIPLDYFLAPKAKTLNKPVKVTFLGRIDPRKGILDVIELFNKIINNDLILDLEIYGIHIPSDPDSLRLHKFLLLQDKITYHPVDRQNYSDEVEKNVINVLHHTDVFIQPYQSLESTVDTPLLLLEAMASSCCVLTTNIADVPSIHGNSNFVFHPNEFVRNAYRLLEECDVSIIREEQNRTYERILSLGLDQETVIKRFLDAI